MRPSAIKQQINIVSQFRFSGYINTRLDVNAGMYYLVSPVIIEF